MTQKNLKLLKPGDVDQFSANQPAPRQSAALDNGGGPPHYPTMENVTPRELDAKLQLLEERMDSRVRRIEDSVASIVNSLSQTGQAIASLKTTTIVTSIGAVLTIVLGIAAFNATLLSNMVSSFESGKNTSTAQAEVKRQTEETATLLKQLQDQVKPAAKAAK